MTALSYRRAHGPTVAQRNAVDLLSAGLRDAEGAEQIGVARETVTRWRLHDPAFRAALGARRAEVCAGTTDGVRAALPLAPAPSQPNLFIAFLPNNFPPSHTRSGERPSQPVAAWVRGGRTAR